jgi:hypothetical protein
MDNTQFVFGKQRWCVSPGQLCSSAHEIACCREQIRDLASAANTTHRNTQQQLSRAIYIDIPVVRRSETHSPCVSLTDSHKGRGEYQFNYHPV